MSEYIEKEAAKNELCSAFAFHSYAGGMAASIIDKIPAADVRENVKATVIIDKNDNEICSNCGCNLLTMYTVHDRLVTHPNFCPNCGAKMEVQDG